MANLHRSGRVFLIFLASLFVACSEVEQEAFQGYVEGEYLYLAAPSADDTPGRHGTIEPLQIPRFLRDTLEQRPSELIRRIPDDHVSRAGDLLQPRCKVGWRTRTLRPSSPC